MTGQIPCWHGCFVLYQVSTLCSVNLFGFFCEPIVHQFVYVRSPTVQCLVPRLFLGLALVLYAAVPVRQRNMRYSVYEACYIDGCCRPSLTHRVQVNNLNQQLDVSMIAVVKQTYIAIFTAFFTFYKRFWSPAWIRSSPHALRSPIKGMWQ